MDPLLQAQFRRLLLGTLVEALVAVAAPVDFVALRLHFDPETAFRVPRLDNYMRFKGGFEAALTGPFLRQAELEAALRGVWPALLSVVALPIGDRLELTRNDVAVAVEAGVLRIAFDLEAD